MPKTIDLIALPILGLGTALTIASGVFFVLIGLPLEEARPWSIVQHARYSDLREFWFALGGGAIIPLIGALLLLAPKPQKLHGDARWAREHEIKKAGLRAKRGIILGKSGGKFLTSNEPAHVLVCAPTRSGKGVGIIIPNLLTFDGSAIIHDIKLENWKITAGFRAQHGHQVFLWSPMNPDGCTHSYNPLDMIREEEIFRISDVQKLASILIPLPRKDPIWDQLARFTFGALVLHALDHAKHGGPPPTIGEIYRTLNDHGDLQAWALETAAQSWIDPECRRLLLSFSGMTDKERSFVKTSMSKALNLWANPLVDAATSKSDFDLRDLRRKRISIYVGVTPDSHDALQPVISLFFQQAMGALTHGEPGEDEPHKVLFLMDEFASLGKMDAIANAFTTIAGYGGRLMVILQAISTLDEHYGREGREVILQNCAHQIFFAASDEITTRYVVSRLGKKTVTSHSRTVGDGRTSRSISQQSRDLMLPQEFQQLSRSKQILLTESARPILGEKISYYSDAAFTPRLFRKPHVEAINLEKRKMQHSEMSNAAAAMLNVADTPLEALESIETSEVDLANELNEQDGEAQPGDKQEIDAGADSSAGDEYRDALEAAFETLRSIADPNVAAEQEELLALSDGD